MNQLPLKLKRLLGIVMVTAIATTLYAQQLKPQLDSKKNLWGYVNSSTGKWVVKPKYEKATEFEAQPNGRQRALVTLKGAQGFLDEAGKPLGAGIVFQEITPLNGDAMFVTVKGKKGVANYDGVYIVKPEATSVEPLNDEGYILTIKNKKGIVNKEGKWILEPFYKSIDTSLPNYFIADLNGKATLLDRKGKTLIEPKEFSDIKPFNDLWKVSKGKKVGLFDLSNNTLLVKPEYADVDMPIDISGQIIIPISEGPDKWGLLKKNGKRVAKTKYSKISPLPNIYGILLYDGVKPKDIYFVERKKPSKVKDYSNTKIGPFQKIHLVYDQDWALHSKDFIEGPDGETYMTNNVNTLNGCYYVLNSPLYKRNGKVALYNHTNRVPLDYHSWTIVGDSVISPDGNVYKASHQNDILYVLDQDNKKRFVNAKGKLSKFYVDKVENLNNLYKIQQNNLWGVSDGNDIVIDCLYDNISNNNDDTFITEKDGKVGAIGKDYKQLIPNEFDKVTVKGPGKYLVEKGNSEAIFDTHKNKWIISPDKGYSAITSTASDGIFIVKKNGKDGLYDAKLHKDIFPAVYDSIEEYGKYLLLKKGNTYTTYNTEEQEVVQPCIDAKLEFVSLKGGPGLDYWVDIVRPGLEEVTMDITIYYSNGKVLKTPDGYIAGTNITTSLSSCGFSYISDRLLFEYANFPWGKHSFYMLIKFKDSKGRVLPHKGLSKIPFTVTRR